MTVIALFLGECHDLYAQRVEGSEFAAAINDTQSNAKAEGLLFIPRDVKRVAAVLVILDYGPASTPLFYDDDVGM